MECGGCRRFRSARSAPRAHRKAAYYTLLKADGLQRADRREEASSVIYRAIDFGEEHGEQVFMARLETMRRALSV